LEKKKREAERYANNQCSNGWQPEKTYSQAFPFALNETGQYDCGNDHIHRKKRADPASK
jgi:hypothetical protein